MNVKKFTSYAVALMMSVSLAPINANALTTDNAVTNGYYNNSGQWVQGELDQTLPKVFIQLIKQLKHLVTTLIR